MPFDYSDLDSAETALVALEYLQASARWFEEAAETTVADGEATRVFSEAAASTRVLSEDLEIRVAEHFPSACAAGGLLQERTKRPSWLVVDGESDLTAEEMLEVATSEQEEHYQFFQQEENEVDDPWLRDLFRELAAHSRQLLIYLEGEREGLVDREGA